jgi:tetratricopeptide (TPR) repeat protein
MELRLSSTRKIEVSLNGLLERVERRFQLIKELEERGEYESALDAFGDLWKGIGHEPKIHGLSEPSRAELLLRAGTLTGWLGSASQIEGAQESAKDLITEGARIFEGLELPEKVAEAHVDLAICYWREGAIDEARVTLHQVLSELGNRESEQRLRALLNMAVVEGTATHFREVLRIDTEAAPLFEKSSNHLLRGKFHNGFAIALKNLGLAENRGDYIDRAFIEFTAAGYHLEQAGNQRLLARLENNLGFLFLTSAKLIEAHQHLNRARALFAKLKDKGSVAQVDDTRARAFLAEGQSQKAEMVVRTSVRTLEQGDEKSLLAEALTTHATALARLGRYQTAFAELRRAMDVAQRAGDPQSGGVAALTLVEELFGQLSAADLREYHRSAELLLASAQHPGIPARLGQAARRILAAEKSDPDTASTSVGPLLGAGDAQPLSSTARPNGKGQTTLAAASTDSSQFPPGCSLEQEVLRYESDLIKRALEASGGSVTRAARLLGVTHQGLAFILNGRHQSLLNARTPAKSRRRSVFRSH